MTGVEPVPQIEAWASTLLSFATWEIVYSTILCLFVLALAFCLRGRLPMLQHGLWALVLLRLVLPPGLASPMSLRGLLAASPVSMMEGALPMWDANHATDEALTLPDRLPAVSWHSIALAAWLAGALVFAAVIARRRFHYRRVVKTARPIRDEELLSRLRWWRTSFRISRPVRLVASEASRLPFTLGTLRPVICLPAELLGDAALVESVIAHELAHIKRWDDLWLRFQNLIQVVYFFHPVTWIAASRMNDEREKLCDAMVLSRRTLSPRVYGRSLLVVLGLDRSERQAIAVAPFANNRKRRLSMRIRHILNCESSTGPRRVLSATLAVVLGLFLLPMADSRANEVPRESPRVQGGLRMTDPLPEGRLTSAFGPRRDPFSDQLVDHPGIDIAAPVGVDIMAPADGVVEVASTNYSGGAHFGSVIIINHGNELKTFYAHLGSLGVEPGQTVRAGQVIAKVGSSGQSTGSHLHFEVWDRGNPVDPLSHLTR